MQYAKNILVRAALAVVIALSLGTMSNPATAMMVSPPEPPALATKTKVKKPWSCKNVLAQRLYKGGFRGENLREAWAVAMRESGGRPDAISSTGDYGVFQFNRAAHSGQPWWNTNRLLTSGYNIGVAYRMSQGGKTWYMWDIGGKGQHLGRYSPRSVYEKYRYWYGKYPCAA